MRRKAAVAVASALLALAGTAAAADVPVIHTEASSLGDTRADLTYFRTVDNGFGGLHLKITKAGTIANDADAAPDCQLCIPAGAGRTRSVHVVDLDRNGTNEVLVDLYSNGAHCCFITDVYEFNPATGKYGRTRKAWGDPSYRLIGRGTPRPIELWSADDSFAYEFTSFAGSVLPIEIWRYRSGRFVDVTRRHPSAVGADARRIRRLYERARKAAPDERDVRGVLAAYVADEALLGRPQTGFALVERARKRGELAGPGPWASGRAYAPALRRFLKRHGYIK
jgi:hypothetical protein